MQHHQLQHHQHQQAATLLNRRRVVLADAMTFATPDMPELCGHFGYPPGQREGLGFPVGKLLGVIAAQLPSKASASWGKAPEPDQERSGDRFRRFRCMLPAAAVPLAAPVAPS